MQYTLRTDPVAKSDKFGEERYQSDSPGQLPMFAMKDLTNPSHPMHAKAKDLVPSVLVDPTTVSDKQRSIMKALLDTWFGTPRNPKVDPPADVTLPESLKLDTKTLSRGSALYRVHCLHCHGVSGDGHGVTARWVVPHPRDFRQGLFKFQSVDQTSGASLPPRREDLRRTILNGVEGTAMPAFNLLAKDQVDELVSYVIHLSLRGKVEYDTFANAFAYDANENKALLQAGELEDNASDEEVGGAIAEAMSSFFKKSIENWTAAQAKAIKMKANPVADGEEAALQISVLRGYNNFIGNVTADTPLAKGFNCVSCHKNFGREATFRWDAWGTLARPNNLTDGIYRGGRRTEDLYHRVHSGINGAGMPPFGGNEAKDAAVWDLVNFVRVLPYPTMRKACGINID